MGNDMRATRATTDTAMQTMRQWLLEFSSLVAATGPHTAKSLEVGAEALRRMCDSATLPVEVAGVPALAPQEIPAPGFAIGLVPAAPAVDVRVVGQVHAPVLSWPAPRSEDIDAVVPLLAERPLFLCGAVDPALRRTLCGAWASTWLDSASDPEAFITPWAQRASSELVTALRAAAVAHAASGLLAGLNADVLREIQTLRTRRALLAQRSVPPAQTPINVEVVAEVRSKIERHVVELMRGLEERLRVAVSPAGALTQAIEQALERVSRIEHSPRIRTTVTRLSEDDERDFLAAVRRAIVSHGLVDLTTVRDLVRLVEQETTDRLGADLSSVVRVSIQPLSDERLKRIAHVSVGLSRHYQGELPKPGFVEYLMIARRYQMVLVMFLSSFGLSAVRSLRHLMIPIGVLLLSLGGLNVARTVRRDRIESQQRELDRARDLLKSEARRMVQEFQRLWPDVISQHLQDQWPPLVTSIERSIRDRMARDAAEAGTARQRAQRQTQGYDALERRLATSSRARDAMASTLAQLLGELRQVIIRADAEMRQS
jgi:hypothetical protein